MSDITPEFQRALKKFNKKRKRADLPSISVKRAWLEIGGDQSNGWQKKFEETYGAPRPKNPRYA